MFHSRLRRLIEKGLLVDKMVICEHACMEDLFGMCFV